MASLTKSFALLGLMNLKIEECIAKDTLPVPKDRLFIAFLRKGVATKQLREIILRYLETRDFEISKDTKSVAVIEATHKKNKKKCNLSIGLNEKNERMLHFQYVDDKGDFFKTLTQEFGEFLAQKALLRSQALQPLPNLTLIPAFGLPSTDSSRDLTQSAPTQSMEKYSNGYDSEQSAENEKDPAEHLSRSESEDEKHEEWTYGQASMTSFREKYERISKTHDDFLFAECFLLAVIKSANEWYLPQSEYKTGEDVLQVPANLETRPLQTFKLTHGHTFGLKVHAPIAFARLRSLFGVSEELFAHSFSTESGLWCKRGAKANNFFYTSNKNFIVRIITEKEAKFFKSTFDDYFKHMIANPKTLLCVICGLYTMSTSAVGQEMNVVILRNFFPTEKPLRHIFDLRGTTIGKTQTESDRDSAISLKDLDFVHYYNGIPLSAGDRETTIKALEKDCEFLASHQMVDYSLVLGVHLPGNGNAPSPAAAKDEDAIVPFYGIVGLFTKYSLNRKLEQQVKSYFSPNVLNALKPNDAETMGPKLHVLDPVQYKERLLHFASTIVFSDIATSSSHNMKAKECGWVLL